MADEVAPPVVPEEPVSSAAAPPEERAGDAGATALASASPASPAAVGAPTETPAAEAPEQAAPAPALSLLGAAVAAEEAKPETATEAAAPPAAVEGPSFTFNLPEGFHASPEQIAAFTGFLGEAGLNQEQGQRLMDLHVAEVQRVHEALAQQQLDTFNEMRAGWRDEFENDPQLGGNRRQTTINTVVGFLRHFASDGDHLNRLMQIADFTGWGDNPDMIRLFANAAKGLQQQYREPGPVRAERPAPIAVSRVQRRYAASANGSSR